MWWDSPAKTGNMRHDLPNGRERGTIVLQEEGCLILWPDSGSLSIQLSQHRNIVVRVDCLFSFQEIHKDHLLPIPKDSTPYLLRAAS